MSLARSTYYYRPRGRSRDEEELIGRIEAICEEFPRYGYRRARATVCFSVRRARKEEEP